MLDRAWENRMLAGWRANVAAIRSAPSGFLPRRKNHLGSAAIDAGKFANQGWSWALESVFDLNEVVATTWHMRQAQSAA